MNPSITTNILHAPFVPTTLPLSADLLCRFISILHQEGYPALEVLCRPAEEALAVVRQLNERPDRNGILLGVGTVLTERVARQVVRMKPDFIVSPAFSRKVLRVAVEADILYIPAVRTFQDVQNVLDAFEEENMPLHVLKLCPVDGLNHDYLRMLGGCFPGIAYCPTGEVTRDNYLHWKSAPFVAAPMGSRFVPREMLEAGQFEQAQIILKEIRRIRDSLTANRRPA